MHGTFKTIETKADPLTMESLIKWLEKMPAKRSYNYEDCTGKCLYGLYMQFHGVAWDDSGAYGKGVNGKGVNGKERSDFCDLVYGQVAAARPWTFGAALERAREAAAALTS